jgi:murein DD-endopeptidase MepM/ murein hydrolase activator NlpD
MRLVSPIRFVVRTVVVCVVVMAAALPAGARGRPTAPPPPAMPAGMAALKTQANQAAARYAAAQTAFAELEDQIADLERQLADLAARIGPLRERITRQAVAVYQADVARAAVASFDAVAAAIRSDHSAHLVAGLSARDVPAINALLETRRRIDARQRDLLARRRDQGAALADLAAQREQISAELTAMAAALPPPSRLPAPRVSRSASALSQRLIKGPDSFVCPIDGPLAFTDDFGAPRGGGRRHMGNDLLSPRGTPNVAVVNGTIETRPWAGGGITVFLYGDDGNTYVYMHLLEIVGAVPRRVAQGEVLGLVGMTGDAQGYHTHFEFHPGNGDAISPYPLLAEACR